VVAEYYFLTGIFREYINNDLLKYVGKPVSICGTIKKVDDWNNIGLASEGIDIASIINKPLIYLARNYEKF